MYLAAFFGKNQKISGQPVIEKIAEFPPFSTFSNLASKKKNYCTSNPNQSND